MDIKSRGSNPDSLEVHTSADEFRLLYAAFRNASDVETHSSYDQETVAMFLAQTPHRKPDVVRANKRELEFFATIMDDLVQLNLTPCKQELAKQMAVEFRVEHQARTIDFTIPEFLTADFH